MADIYSIKEMYYTVQGEGYHTGRPAVFCRFSGCNLWSGLEKDRHDAICKFCDTDFWGTDGLNGGKYTANELVELCLSLWPKNAIVSPFVVFTGGEPLLQLDEPLITAFHRASFFIAIETNGTLKVPKGVDWVCVSPKGGAKTIVESGNELKIVYPQDGIDPSEFINQGFDHFFLQPLDDQNLEINTKLVIEYCRSNPLWRISLQTHKLMGIP